LNLPIAERGLVAANAATATTLSAAAGGISALFTNLVIEERRTGEYTFVMLMAINGCLSGLVAITSGCSVVEPWAALVTGVVAGWIYMTSSYLLERCRIDDAVNAIPVHMCNGAWGLIATGLFASPRRLDLTYGSSDHIGLFYSFARDSRPDGVLLACQLVALVLIFGWTFCTMVPFFFWLNYRGWLRSDSYEELIGLDISYHGGALRNTVDDGVGVQFIDARRKQAKELHRTQVHIPSHLPNPHNRVAGHVEVDLGSGKSSSETYPTQVDDHYDGADCGYYDEEQIEEEVRAPMPVQDESVCRQSNFVEPMDDYSQSDDLGVDDLRLRPEAGIDIGGDFDYCVATTDRGNDNQYDQNTLY
jgi:Ammonium Transporter Family